MIGSSSTKEPGDNAEEPLIDRLRKAGSWDEFMNMIPDKVAEKAGGLEQLFFSLQQLHISTNADPIFMRAAFDSLIAVKRTPNNSKLAAEQSNDLWEVMQDIGFITLAPIEKIFSKYSVGNGIKELVTRLNKIEENN